MPIAPQLLARNRLLAGIDASLRDRLAQIGVLTELEFKQTLFEQGAPIERVAFPLAGVCSLLSVMQDGRTLEVATVGNEGFVGLPVFLQATLTSAHRASVQIPGQAVTLDAARFLDLSNSGGTLQAVLQRYAQALITQIAQGAACNRLHSVEKRCARWLLQTHDRVQGDRFPLTQEFLGQMLGIGRQSVNEAATALQRAGLLSYSRGEMTIVDRPGLERAACECYALVRAEFDRLLPSAR